jgi:hypothetical protein
VRAILSRRQNMTAIVPCNHGKIHLPPGSKSGRAGTLAAAGSRRSDTSEARLALGRAKMISPCLPDENVLRFCDGLMDRSDTNFNRYTRTCVYNLTVQQRSDVVERSIWTLIKVFLSK